ncbi:MAG: amino acid ABC transporter permease, partial [Acetobacteraceae bacterium]
AVKTFGGGALRAAVSAYVSFFMNTPQLVQIYFLFFVLPDQGILLSPYQAVLIGMTLNAGAYLTEIQRAGFLSVHRAELEAAETLGMSTLQTVRYVILPHIMRVLFPSLANQYILMTLGTSMAAIFGVEELTGRAFNISSKTFRTIEVFTTAAGLYVIITLIATFALAEVGRRYFRARMRIV